MKEDANEITKDPHATDEKFGVSRKTDENCSRDRYEGSCSEKGDFSRRNTFTVTDEATNRSMTEKGQMVESMEVNAKVKMCENKRHHSSSKSTELKHTLQPSKNRNKISALTTWPDHLTTLDDHLTTSKDHQTTSTDYLSRLDESEMLDARLSNLPVTRINCSNCHNSKMSEQNLKMHNNNNNCMTGNMEKIREEVRNNFFLKLFPFDLFRCGRGLSIWG